MGFGYRNTSNEFTRDDVADIYGSDSSMDLNKTARRRKKAKRSRRVGSRKAHRKVRHVRHHKTRSRRVSHRSKRSSGGLHYTKNGQPYRILSNGRARFVKKR